LKKSGSVVVVKELKELLEEVLYTPPTPTLKMLKK
jgi:hypothetical protein